MADIFSGLNIGASTNNPTPQDDQNRSMQVHSHLASIAAQAFMVSQERAIKEKTDLQVRAGTVELANYLSSVKDFSTPEAESGFWAIVAKNPWTTKASEFPHVAGMFPEARKAKDLANNRLAIAEAHDESRYLLQEANNLARLGRLTEEQKGKVALIDRKNELGYGGLNIFDKMFLQDLNFEHNKTLQTQAEQSRSDENFRKYLYNLDIKEQVKQRSLEAHNQFRVSPLFGAEYQAKLKVILGGLNLDKDEQMRQIQELTDDFKARSSKEAFVSPGSNTENNNEGQVQTKKEPIKPSYQSPPPVNTKDLVPAPAVPTPAVPTPANGSPQGAGNFISPILVSDMLGVANRAPGPAEPPPPPAEPAISPAPAQVTPATTPTVTEPVPAKKPIEPLKNFSEEGLKTVKISNIEEATQFIKQMEEDIKKFGLNADITRQIYWKILELNGFSRKPDNAPK